MANVIFFGTPDYVLPILEALTKEHKVMAVVTQPPKRVGRTQTPTPSPVARWSGKNNIRVITNLDALQSIEADIGVLAAYGKILPKEVIDYFPYGILNVHPSLLPKYRGASPVQAAIMAVDKQTGVTIIKLDEEVDHGPIVARFTETIRDNDTTGTLRKRLFRKAAAELPEILYRYVVMKIPPKEQEHEKATFTTLIKKSDGFIPPRDVTEALDGKDSQRVERFIRAMQPWPGGYTNIKLTRYQGSKIARLKILKAHTGGGKLTLDQVQLEGKNPVTWKQFKEGYPEADFN